MPYSVPALELPFVVQFSSGMPIVLHERRTSLCDAQEARTSQSFRFRTVAGEILGNLAKLCAAKCTVVQTAGRSGSGDQDRSGHGVVLGTPWLQCTCRVSAAETVTEAQPCCPIK